MADWYARTQAELGPWWANFILRRPDFEAKYPILNTMKSELIAIGAWVAYWVPARHAFDELSTQQTGYFNTISGNDTSLDPPAPITWTMPPGQPAEVPPGFEKVIREIRREVVGLTNYAKADGEALGFESTSTKVESANAVKPTLQAFPAANDHHFSLVVNGREGVTMWDVYILRSGGTWTKVETCSGKSADISVSLTETGKAEQIQVRVQLRKSNENYGQVSEPVYVTLNP